MSNPYASTPARVNPFAGRPVYFGVTTFFVMLGVRSLIDQLRVAWSDASAREDFVVIRLVPALAVGIVFALFVRKPGRDSA